MLEVIKGLIDEIESNIFIGYFPDDSIDDICTIYNTPGRPAEMTFDGGVVRYPSFQIRVRDKSYSSGESRMIAIINELMGSKDEDVIFIGLESDLMDLGKDKRSRSEFTANFNYILKVK